MTQPTSPTDILGQINSARDQTYQNIATAQGILDQANAAASAAARDRAAIQAIAQQTVRVDTSVGTRVFAGDTMIYGDTGWRMIPYHTEVVSGELRIRRVNNTVALNLSAIVPVEGSGLFHIMDSRSSTSLPYGFRGRDNERNIYFVGEANNGTAAHRLAFYSHNLAWGGRAESLGGVRPPNLQGTITWFANQAWPTSLPGTPA